MTNDAQITACPRPRLTNASTPRLLLFWAAFVTVSMLTCFGHQARAGFRLHIAETNFIAGVSYEARTRGAEEKLVLLMPSLGGGGVSSESAGSRQARIKPLVSYLGAKC
jgi:hypothetical protein